MGQASGAGELSGPLHNVKPEGWTMVPNPDLEFRQCSQKMQCVAVGTWDPGGLSCSSEKATSPTMKAGSSGPYLTLVLLYRTHLQVPSHWQLAPCHRDLGGTNSQAEHRITQSHYLGASWISSNPSRERTCTYGLGPAEPEAMSPSQQSSGRRGAGWQGVQGEEQMSLSIRGELAPPGTPAITVQRQR